MSIVTIARSLPVAVLLILTPFAVAAGEWHNGQTDCSDCHTTHNSENGLPVPGNLPGGSPYTLRRGTAQELCLSCHGGGTATAPDVTAPSYVPDPAGGWLDNTTDAVYQGHRLGVTMVPPGGFQQVTITCTTCHDPHGNGNYRNLRPNPSGTAAPDVSVLVRQQLVANGSNPAAVYVRPNLVDKSGISDWCSTCHGPLEPGSDHPVDRPIWGGTSSSYARWSTNLTNRTRADSPADDAIPSQDDEVTCLSCHKAHGTGTPHALFYADGVTVDSTCQQCHNQ